jgi:hypothetical protein
LRPGTDLLITSVAPEATPPNQETATEQAKQATRLESSEAQAFETMKLGKPSEFTLSIEAAAR